MDKPTTNRADRARFALVAALYKQQLGEVIRERRESLGLTQKDLAQRANVEEAQTVSRWERGLNSPTDLDAVARALDTTAEELLRQLKPIGQKERRRLVPHEAGTQLDRIEAKLDAILGLLLGDAGAAGDAASVIARGFVAPHELPEGDEAPSGTALRSDATPESPRARAPRTRRSA